MGYFASRSLLTIRMIPLSASSSASAFGNSVDVGTVCGEIRGALLSSARRSWNGYGCHRVPAATIPHRHDHDRGSLPKREHHVKSFHCLSFTCPNLHAQLLLARTRKSPCCVPKLAALRARSAVEQSNERSFAPPRKSLPSPVAFTAGHQQDWTARRTPIAVVVRPRPHIQPHQGPTDTFHQLGDNHSLGPSDLGITPHAIPRVGLDTSLRQ